MRRIVIAVGCLVAAGAALGQPPAKRAAGLDVVPADGFAFVSLNVAKVWDTQALKGLRDALLKVDAATVDSFEKEFGLPLADLDRVTFLWPAFPDSFQDELPVAVVSTRKPYDRAKVLKALEAETFEATEKQRGQKKAVPSFPGGGIKKSYDLKGFPPPFPGTEVAPPPFKKEPMLVAFQRGEGQPKPEADGDAASDLFLCRKVRRVLFLLDDSTALFLPTEERVPQQLLTLLSKTLRKKVGGPLTDALAVADKHAAVAGLDFRPVRQDILREERFPRDLVPFRALTKMDGGFATLDLDAKSGVTATLRFPTADDATRAEPVLKTAIQLAVEELGRFKKRISTNEPQAAFGVPLLDAILGALDKATVKADDTRVTAAATLDIGPAVEKAISALPAYVKWQKDEMQTLNNLKQLGLALHSFHDANGHFPQDIVDRAGKPILSWRVQILPYLEQDNLYRALDLTKAWDDPANAKALAKMPKVFTAGARAAKEGETYFQMFTSAKPLPGGSPVLVPGRRRTFTSITDGTSNTFGVVEAAEAVNWAKPGDLPFDPKKLPALGDPKTGKFRVVMLDGSVRSLRRDKITDEQLRAFITVDGGEVNTYEDRK